MTNIQSNWDVVVAGGGPAGFFAAIRCAELDPTLRVLIIEKASQTLGKVLISGGGRCNVTHACFDPALLITYYPRGSNELRGAFSRFQPRDTVDWFESRGVKIKTEADGRMFPVSDLAETIAESLREAAKKAGVQMRPATSLLGVEKGSKIGFQLEVRNARVSLVETRPRFFHPDKKAADRHGERSQNTGDRPIAWPLGRRAGTFSVYIQCERSTHRRAGRSVDGGCCPKTDSIIQRGALLITHWGLSGPVVLAVSAWGARELHDRKYRATLIVNWLGDYHFDKALEILQRNKDWQENTRKKVSTQQAFTQIPVRLWKQLVLFIGDKNWGDVSKTELRTLAQELTAGEFSIEGKGQFKDEFVTCGGVRLHEVDFKTMQSRLVKDLFFAGEA